MLQRLDRRKIDTVHQKLRRMQSIETLFNALIYKAIIKRAAFPAHAADQSDSFHEYTLAPEN